MMSGSCTERRARLHLRGPSFCQASASIPVYFCPFPLLPPLGTPRNLGNTQPGAPLPSLLGQVCRVFILGLWHAQKLMGPHLSWALPRSHQHCGPRHPCREDSSSSHPRKGQSWLPSPSRLLFSTHSCLRRCSSFLRPALGSLGNSSL